MLEARFSGNDAPGAYPPTVITSTAARSPLGLSSFQVAMCARARKVEPRSTQFVDKRGRSVGMCTTPGIPRGLVGYERMLALGAPALRAVIPRDMAAMRLPVILSIPEPGRPDDDPRLEYPILTALAKASGASIDEERSRTVRAGHAGGSFALSLALAELNRGAPAVLVGGVDTYYHPDVVAWLDEECRLHALDAEDGFVPSEGAAFVLLERLSPGSRPHAGRQRHATRLVQVELGAEDTVISNAPNVAATMTRLLARIASSTADGRISWVLTDVNGERHRRREWDVAALRGSLADEAVQDHMVDDLGDMGAAIGPMLTVVACEFFRTGGAPSPMACIALHAEGAQRGAFLLAHEGNR